jgi:broad specificity phosphatase PhoE
VKSVRVCLIRHGETEWSRLGRHTSHTDLPLTSVGEAQARQLGAQLDGVRFDQVWCSPRRRARETCRLAGLDGQAVIDSELREWDYGQYEGLRSIEIRKLVPDWNLFLHGCPGGDSPEQIVARIDGVIARLRLLQGNSAIVAHGHFLRVLGARWLGLPVTAAEQFQLGTASVSVLGEDGALHLWNHSVDAVTLMLSSA